MKPKLTPEQREKMLREYAAGVPIAVLGQRYGIRPEGVCRTAARHGLAGRSAPRWTKARDEALRKLISSGYSASEAGDELGVTKSAVIGRARRLGIHLNGGGQRKPKADAKKAGNKAAAQTKVVVMKPAVVVPVVQAVPVAVGIPIPRRIKLLDLGVFDCRWVVEGDRADAMFCGNEVEGFTSWCPHHRRMVFPTKAPLVRAA